MRFQKRSIEVLALEPAPWGREQIQYLFNVGESPLPVYSTCSLGKLCPPSQYSHSLTVLLLSYFGSRSENTSHKHATNLTQLQSKKWICACCGAGEEDVAFFFHWLGRFSAREGFRFFCQGTSPFLPIDTSCSYTQKQVWHRRWSLDTKTATSFSEDYNSPYMMQIYTMSHHP